MNQTNMNEIEKQFFLSIISGKDRYVEYGAGQSTDMARAVCGSVKSIETDKEWADMFKAVHVNMGETTHWGYPRKQPSITELHEYFSHARDFDILFIDGRFRTGVALHAQPGLILIHDYERTEYHLVEKFMEKIDQVDRLALFQKTEPAIVTLEVLSNPI